VRYGGGGIKFRLQSIDGTNTVSAVAFDTEARV
jgi:hypothetical protein